MDGVLLQFLLCHLELEVGSVLETPEPASLNTTAAFKQNVHEIKNCINEQKLICA